MPHYQLTLSMCSALGDLWSIGPEPEWLLYHHITFLLTSLANQTWTLSKQNLISVLLR